MTEKTEPLTDTMIRKLRSEAAAAGDHEQVDLCDAALYPSDEADRERGMEGVCLAINSARAMDDSRPYVRVIFAENEPD